jgi:hypothetical protein
VYAVHGVAQGCCSDVVNVVTTSQIDIDCKDLSRKAPLLLTELVVAPEGASFTYSTPIDSMHSKVIAVFDRAITKLQVGLHCACHVQRCSAVWFDSASSVWDGRQSSICFLP